MAAAFPVLLVTLPVTTISVSPLGQAEPASVKAKLNEVTPLFFQVTLPFALLSLPVKLPEPPVIFLVQPENVPVADSVTIFTEPLRPVHVTASVAAAGTAAPAGLDVRASTAPDAGIIKAAGTRSTLPS